jgi:hypothetical protein
LESISEQVGRKAYGVMCNFDDDGNFDYTCGVEVSDFSRVPADWILFENVVQVLHGSVSTALAQRPFLLTVGDRGAVNRRQVSVDHSRLRMGSIAERLAKQALGSIGVTER